jgi:CRISPR-associated endonuclease Cas1
MAATKTVPQLPSSGNSDETTITPRALTSIAVPRCGVVTLSGYGIKVSVNQGHLTFEDGIGAARRRVRCPRVGHGLRRLVVIGADGMISLSSLRWLADQDAAFVMLDRDGSVLATTGPVRPSDARLRRAQALAAQTGVDVTIARELISQKLAGQERVARDKLHNSVAAQTIADCRLDLAEAQTVEAIRGLEAQGAAAYWAAWRDVKVTFPSKDLTRVPEHWRNFGTRKSLLTGSPRLATNPANAILNYLYAVIESEARLAAAALGLDPGLGFIHVDTPARDSLACDLMEPVRPQVDAYLLDWLTQQPLRREWFFEQRDGNCRLMGPFAVRLSETAPVWARAVAPLAEWVARKLWSGRQNQTRSGPPPTRLTQAHRREVKGGSTTLTPIVSASQRENICRGCGKPIAQDSSNCPECYMPTAAQQLRKAAHAGRVAAHTPSAEARRGETQRRQATTRRAWQSSEPPPSLTEDVYVTRIQPLLARATTSAIRFALGVSRGYAADIRRGKRRPHPRHWQALARLVGIS